MTPEQIQELINLLNGSIIKADRVARGIDSYRYRIKHAYTRETIAKWVIADLKRGKSLDYVMTWLART
jgi:hypothetical protein